MNIRINETGEIETLKIIDPRSGIEWTNDLLGNYNAVGYDDETDQYTMSQETFDWWAELILELVNAEERVAVLRAELSGESFDRFDEEILAVACDLEDYPKYLDAVCDEYEANTK